jgi:hypothetical protein
MNRILCAILFATASSAFVHADCQPDKDHRKAARESAGLGVEVVVMNLSGATTVDSAELTKITDDMIGSCFDDEQELEEKLNSLFHATGYVSAHIENLQTESVNREVTPAPVQVNGSVIEGEKCPSDVKGLHQFLLDHRSNSLEADPTCVDGAFGKMATEARYRHSRFYTRAMVNLLDFERQDENPWFSHHFVRYPATEVLHFPAAVPYLVDAIKQSDSELVRTNAADAIFWIYRECTPAAVTKMNQEAEKPETTPEQTTRLQIAAEYIGTYFPGGPGTCKSPSGEPTTEKERQKELDSETE